MLAGFLWISSMNSRFDVGWCVFSTLEWSTRVFPRVASIGHQLAKLSVGWFKKGFLGPTQKGTWRTREPATCASFMHADADFISILIYIQTPFQESEKSGRIPQKNRNRKATPNYPMMFHMCRLPHQLHYSEKLSAQEMRQLFGVSSRSQIDPWVWNHVFFGCKTYRWCGNGVIWLICTHWILINMYMCYMMYSGPIYCMCVYC